MTSLKPLMLDERCLTVTQRNTFTNFMAGFDQRSRSSTFFLKAYRTKCVA